MTKPFLPSDLDNRQPLSLWRRHATAIAVAHIREAPVDYIAKHYWGHEPGVCEAIAKAASVPASSGGWGGELGAGAVSAWLGSLAPTSEAARLLAAAARVKLDGAAVAVLPRGVGALSSPVFVGEGQPIPAMQGSFTGATLGPQRKLAAITGLTGELAEYTGDVATEIIEIAMRDAASAALDSAVFSAAPATSIAPAGLLNGVTPIASGGGVGFNAMVADLKALAGAIADSGGGRGVLYFTNPRQAMPIRLQSDAVAGDVVSSSRIPACTVIAIETGAIVSAFDGLPQIDVADATAIHWEDTTPAQIGTAGTPNVVAAPTMSMFQTHSLALRLILRCAWASRMSGAVQFLTGATW